MYPLNILIAEPDMMLRTLYRKTVSEVPGYVFAGYADNGDALHSIVACTAVNDVHVMNAWSVASGNDGKIMMTGNDGDAAVAVVIVLFDD